MHMVIENMKHKKAVRTAGAVLTAAVMAAIFFFSSQNAESSAWLSLSLLELLNLGVFGIVNYMIRKTAHFTEFAALAFSAFLFAVSFADGMKKRLVTFVYPLIFSVLYAVSDEIHQLFVPGRACQLKDVLIDSAGALTALLITNFIYGKIISKERNKP